MNFSFSKKTMPLFVLFFFTTIFVIFIIKEKFDEKTDFFIFYESSNNLIENKPIYWHVDENPAECPRKEKTDQQLSINNFKPESTSLEKPVCKHPNLNPPLFVQLMSVFTFFKYSTAHILWSFLSFFMGIFSLIILFKNSIPQSFIQFSPSLIISGCMFYWFPVYVTFQYGQVSFLLLLVLTLSWNYLRRGNTILSGIWIGAGVSLKPFMGLFLISLLMNRQWSTLIAAIFTILGLVGLTCLLTTAGAGVEVYLNYFEVLKTVNWYDSNWNASIYGFLSRIFIGSETVSLINTPKIGHVLVSCCYCFFLYQLARTASLSQSSEHVIKIDRMFALTVPTMLLLSPLGWIYYFPLLIVPGRILLEIVQVQCYKTKNAYSTLLFATSVIFTTIPTILFFTKNFLEANQYFFSLLSFYSLVLITIFKIQNYYSEPNPQE